MEEGSGTFQCSPPTPTPAFPGHCVCPALFPQHPGISQSPCFLPGNPCSGCFQQHSQRAPGKGRMASPPCSDALSGKVWECPHPPAVFWWLMESGRSSARRPSEKSSTLSGLGLGLSIHIPGAQPYPGAYSFPQQSRWFAFYSYGPRDASGPPGCAGQGHGAATLPLVTV